MICKNCGIEINDDNKFCTGCGAVVEQPEVTNAAEPEAVPAAAPAAPVYYQPQPQQKEFTENDLPEQYRPLGAWAYFGLQILFSIPIVGLVFLIVFSFSRGNLNRRSFARSYWCAALVGVAVVVLLLIFAAVLGFGAKDFFDEMMYY